MSSQGRAPDEYVVGREADLPPGAHKVVRIRNLEVGVFNVDGTFYALPNMCPHQYGPLCEGTVGGAMRCGAETGWRFQWGRNGEILTCPWHGLEFDLKTGECLATKIHRVRQYPVRVVAGEICVRLGRGTARAQEASTAAPAS